jgi:hypothetical protein
MHEASASPDASSHDAAEGPFAGSNPGLSTRCGMFEGHLPDEVEPLIAPGIEDSFTETRKLRRDGWTSERKRRFLEELAETGIFLEACRAVGISSRSAYNLCDRDPLFAAGCDAAAAMTRRRLADDVYTRSVNGCVERIYRDGVIVAERHRYDNRLSMAVLHRLDARLDRARERGDKHLNAMRRWDDYLDALGEDRREDAMAILTPPEPEPEPEPEFDSELEARRCELRELSLEERHALEDRDEHNVWRDEDGTWWTDYPPPHGFGGEEHGSWGGDDYRRTLGRAELAVMEGDEATDLAVAEMQRDSCFGLRPQSSPPRPAQPHPSKSVHPAPAEGEEAMSGSRRDSGDGTRGGPVHGRGSKSVDDNKKSGGGHGKPGGSANDDNAHPPGGGAN